MISYPPAAAEPLTLTTRHGTELHWPNAYGQHHHHKAGPTCPCGPTIEERK